MNKSKQILQILDTKAQVLERELAERQKQQVTIVNTIKSIREQDSYIRMRRRSSGFDNNMPDTALNIRLVKLSELIDISLNEEATIKKEIARLERDLKVVRGQQIVMRNYLGVDKINRFDQDMTIFLQKEAFNKR